MFGYFVIKHFTTDRRTFKKNFISTFTPVKNFRNIEIKTQQKQHYEWVQKVISVSFILTLILSVPGGTIIRQNIILPLVPLCNLGHFYFHHLLMKIYFFLYLLVSSYTYTGTKKNRADTCEYWNKNKKQLMHYIWVINKDISFLTTFSCIFWHISRKYFQVLAQQRTEQARMAAVQQQTTANAEAPVDPVSFLASLPSSLRQQVLADMDDSTVAVLPPDLAAEAQALRRELEERHRRLMQERLFAQAAGAGSLSAILRHSGACF